MIGIAAFVFNFAGALMYLLQERQLKVKRPGAFYYRLPALETLDRLTFRTLALGFPFLTTGLVLGAHVGAGGVGQRVHLRSAGVLLVPGLGDLRGDAGGPGGRPAGTAGGRPTSRSSGFAALVLTLGAGLFLPGRHGS